jgi:hypothetical protein
MLSMLPMPSREPFLSLNAAVRAYLVGSDKAEACFSFHSSNLTRENRNRSCKGAWDDNNATMQPLAPNIWFDLSHFSELAGYGLEL